MDEHGFNQFFMKFSQCNFAYANVSLIIRKTHYSKDYLKNKTKINEARTHKGAEGENKKGDKEWKVVQK